MEITNQEDNNIDMNIVDTEYDYDDINIEYLDNINQTVQALDLEGGGSR